MSLRVLYVGAALPSRSETFVYNELLALRARGVPAFAASVHAPEFGLGEERLDALAQEAIPIYGKGVARVLLDAALELMRRPFRGIGTLGMAIGDAVLSREIAMARRLRIPCQALAGLALARRVQPLEIRHIHAHMAHVPATIAMYAARQLGVPFSFTGHANDLFAQRSLLREKLLRSAFTACISRWHRDFYRTLADLPDTRLPIIRCGVEMPDSPPLRRRPETAVFRILSVGRLVPKKGFDVLFRAIAELVRRGRPIQCRIAGNGPQREVLEQRRRDLALEDAIRFEGPVPNATVKTMLRDVDLFVLPCQVDASGDQDGIPVALMEAMAAGVCTVSGDLPAIRELIEHRVSGWLVPPGDAEALSAALEALMADPDLRTRLAEEGRRHVAAEFSLSANVDRLLHALEFSRQSRASSHEPMRS